MPNTIQTQTLTQRWSNSGQRTSNGGSTGGAGIYNNPNASNQSTAGNFNASNQVVKQDGNVNYSEPKTDVFAGILKDALSNVTNFQLAYQKGLSDVTKQFNESDPMAKANVQYRLAEVENLRKSGGPDNKYSGFDIHSPYDRMIMGGLGMIPKSTGMQQYEAALQRGRDRDNLIFLNQVAKDNLTDKDKAELAFKKTDNQAQRSLDEMIARIQQPLNAGQVLEKARIENPDSIKGMATNLLGSYASQGGRSNFAYWG